MTGSVNPGQPGPGEQLTNFACLDCRRVFKRSAADVSKRNWPRLIEMPRPGLPSLRH